MNLVVTVKRISGAEMSNLGQGDGAKRPGTGGAGERERRGEGCRAKRTPTPSRLGLLDGAVRGGAEGPRGSVACGPGLRQMVGALHPGAPSFRPKIQ